MIDILSGLLAIYVLSLPVRDAFQYNFFVHKDKTSGTLYHIISAIQFLITTWLFDLVIFPCSSFELKITEVFVICVFRWLTFDPLFNALTNRQILYVGKTSVIDRTMQYLSSKTRIHPQYISLIIKLSLVITLIILLIWFKKG